MKLKYDFDEGLEPQKAINIICEHLLGEDWYIVDPVSNIQANVIIVNEILNKFPSYKSVWRVKNPNRRRFPKIKLDWNR